MMLQYVLDKLGLVLAGKTRVLAIGGVVVVAMLASSPWSAPFIRAFLFETTGSIYISGPQIYTRERLVNDRYREDAWLLSELEGSPKLPFGIISSAKYSTNSAGAVSLLESDPEKHADPGTSDAKSTRDADKPPDLDPFNKFKSLLTYREQVRSLMIENQLDDRHDLRGNSLYRLKFDAAVLPGNNTRRSAKVSVSVLPPEGMFDPEITEPRKKGEDARVREQVTKFGKVTGFGECPTKSNDGRNPPTKSNDERRSTDTILCTAQHDVWKRIYERWLDSLEKRFEDSKKTLRKAYEAERFSPGYYKSLLDAIKNSEQGAFQLSDEILTKLKKIDKGFVQEIKADYRYDQVVQNPLFGKIFNNIEQDHWTITDANAEKQEKDLLDQYREKYAKGITVDDAVHRALKSKIDEHIIGVLNEAKVYNALKLWYDNALKLGYDNALKLGYENVPEQVEQTHPITEEKPGEQSNPVTVEKPGEKAKPSCKPLLELSPQRDPLPAGDEAALRFFMHKAFMTMLSKSVLGQELIESRLPRALIGGDKPSVFSTLARALIEGDKPSVFSTLAAVTEHPAQENGGLKFEPQTVNLWITDNEACSSNPSVVPISIAGRTIYYSQSGLEQITRLLPRFNILDIDEDLKREITRWNQTSPPVAPQPQKAPADVSPQTAQPPVATGQDFSARQATPKAIPHESTINVEVGLINFIRLAGRRLDAFSYAFTPSEPDEISATQALAKSSAALRLQAAGKQAGVSGNASLESTAERDWNDVRKLVIGFGKQANPTIPTFGWMIQPQEEVEVGSRHYRQRPSQLSLTALISLPAWWDEVRVQIKREWAPESEDPETESENAATNGGEDLYTIELPVNFETIDAALFEKNNRGPVIEEWAAQPADFRVCDEKAALIIPGRRLWRSTIVTLGSQKAEEIFVLPDMNGIIATFGQIKVPTSLPDPKGNDFLVPITVWTSQGSVTLPLPAKIRSTSLPCPTNVKKTEALPPPAPSSARTEAPAR